jgi:hypothetical protein
MSSTTATAAQNEHERNINDENTPPQSSQVLMSPETSTQTPILTEQVYMTSVAEDEMIHKINVEIRRLLTRPNHQSPYRYNFRWRIDEEPNLNYSVFLCIKEPSRRMILH